MQPEAITQAVTAAIADAQVQVQMEGNHAHLTVVSTAFEGLMPVKRQQLVYATLSEFIASGVIHAVHMKTFTPEQWAKQS